MVIDESGRITFANQVAATLVGCSHRELLERRITDLLAGEPDAKPAILSSLQPADGVARLDTLHAICADGSRLAVDVISSPMHQPGARQWAVVMANDTERRERMHRLRQELDEIGWIGRITDALDHDSLVLHAQPIVGIGSRDVRHHELLLRLRSADGSLIAPGQFLPTAEKHGLITQIDRWVLGRALEIAASGRRVAVNLAAATLADSDAPCYIADQIQRSDADPRNLLFEITETAVLSDLHAGQNLVNRLVELGCHVALDDFGTGYGGFTYLKHLPVSVLKIDSEFVRDVAENPASDHVIRAIVGLARSFDLETVAEGVEDERTLETLRRLGVDLAQGYLIGRPEPFE
jgi:PAS domain S-box-containing protein